MLAQRNYPLITDTVNELISIIFDDLRLNGCQWLIYYLKQTKRTSLLDLYGLLNKLITFLPKLDFLVINVLVELVYFYSMREL